MPWGRNEIWFDVDVGWLREEPARPQPALALPPPAFLDALLALDIRGDGLTASRRRRAELRRQRTVRRTRAAALVLAPATLLPIASQRLGVGPAAGGRLAEDPPSSVRDESLLGPVRAAAAPAPKTVREEFPAIEWRRATSHGLPSSGSLSDGTQLPLEGPDWVTWNPVRDRVPNEAHRLHGHEGTIRTIVSVLAAYRSENPGAPRAVVGDISFRHGGPMEQHVSHQNGLDVDIYYPRLDRRLRAPRSGSQIDRRLTQDLVDRFVAAGAQKIFVGYSTELRGPSDVVVPYPNHGDHMHVRFPPPRD
jgi:murein endopeptidase